MSDHEDQPTFENADAGAALTYPAQCSALRKNGHVVIKGFPCKIVDMSTSKTGKHGHAKVNLVATDIFTGKKYEDVSPSTHNMDVPNVKRTEYQLVNIDDGYLNLLLPSGDSKDDVKVPEGEMGEKLEADFNEGKDLMVSILSAMGQEACVSYKEAAGDRADTNWSMRYGIFIAIELFIVVAVITTLYSLLPHHTEPIFRPRDVLDSYVAVDEIVYKEPYSVGNPPPRSFEEPDYGLLTSPPPSAYGCSEDSTPKLFIGIFSTPRAHQRRALIRSLMSAYFESVGRTVLDYRFVVGEGSAKEMRGIENEEAEHGDILHLSTPENMDNGKTFHYMQELLQWHARDAHFRPQFVAKCDDDTMLIIPAVLRSLGNLNCSDNIYWGTSAGRSQHFPEYLRGLAYILSWPLVGWIGGSDVSVLHQQGIEDARTGQWLQMLQYLTPKQDVVRVDNGWNMGDWNQLSISEQTLALHWLKLDEWWHAQSSIVAQAWRLEDGEWRWQGLPAQEEEEQRKKEKHRAAVVEKARVRESMERQGEVFDDKAYNREHPEAT
ncbi:hypothetical protein E3P99_00060 [Wallemia hederae]|uniref:Translation initiation factor 5A C-terminal domain-containing protein n=1 Tax=Wallemia hederae TaxID=1540922 RepID=A0A4T0FXU7_9BASI|nr:hypothetical protein E3P99_00060 [Wallemia hederae]